MCVCVPNRSQGSVVKNDLITFSLVTEPKV